MVIRDKDYDISTVERLLVDNAIGRNRELSTFIGLLNTIQFNSFIAIDGKWGSGKSVFVKQVEYLNYCDTESAALSRCRDIESELVKTFQDKYVTYYYNAWENDHHDDPLQSLLFNLIDSLYTQPKFKEKAKSVSKNAVKSVLVSGIKALTKDIVDLEKIGDVETIDDLVRQITTITERKNAVTKIVHSVVPDDKKLLFIIDELDRCNPNFAMRLLEVIKHYYNDDNIVFVISTNNTQLIHTVKKHYGEGFDGYAYLNKFYDLAFQLPEITVDTYITTQLKVPKDSYYKNILPREVVKHFNFTMREMNRYYSSISLVMGYLSADNRFDNSLESNLTRYVFTPLALGLKIHSAELYERFIRGNGEGIVREFFDSSEEMLDYFVSRHITETTDKRQPVDIAVEAYRKVLLADKPPNRQENYQSQEAGERFKNALELIRSTGRLDEPKEDAQDT